MKFDFLFDSDTHVSVSAIDDLLIGYMANEIFGCRNDKYACFVRVISHPLTHHDTICKRQSVMRDLLNYPGLIAKLIDVSKRGKSIQQTADRRTLYQKNDAQNRVKINFGAVTALFDVVDEFGQCVRSCCFETPELKAVQSFFADKSRIDNLRERLSEHKRQCERISFCRFRIKLSEQAKFKAVTLLSVSKPPLFSADLDKPIALFKKNRTETLLLDYSSNFDFERQINQIIEKSLFDFCAVLSSIYAKFKKIFESLYEQFLFYSAAIEYQEYLTGHRLPCCTALLKPNGTIKSEGLLFLPLVAGSIGTITANDFDSNEDTVFVITGYNRGGKTTFLRSIGFAQLLAQAGLPIPAVRYECPIFSYILTHFPKDEDKALSHGLFENEIRRLYNDMKYYQKSSLVLMNESFASTIESEGEEIAEELLRVYAQTGSMVFFVTHFLGLAENIDILNAKICEFSGKSKSIIEKLPHAVNLITQRRKNADDVRNSFRIVRGDVIHGINVNLQDYIKEPIESKLTDVPETI